MLWHVALDINTEQTKRLNIIQERIKIILEAGYWEMGNLFFCHKELCAKVSDKNAYCPFWD